MKNSYYYYYYSYYYRRCYRIRRQFLEEPLSMNGLTIAQKRWICSIYVFYYITKDSDYVAVQVEMMHLLEFIHTVSLIPRLMRFLKALRREIECTYCWWFWFYCSISWDDSIRLEYSHSVLPSSTVVNHRLIVYNPPNSVWHTLMLPFYLFSLFQQENSESSYESFLSKDLKTSINHEERQDSLNLIPSNAEATLVQSTWTQRI